MLRRHCSSLAPSAAAQAAATLDANPANPLRVFWRALNDKTLKGPGVAVGIAMDARCGLGREATEQDVRSFPNMLRCINPGDTPWTLAALADRTDVLIEMIAADEGIIVPLYPDALPAAAKEGPIRSAVAKMGLTQVHVAACKSDWMAVARGRGIGCRDGFDRTALHLAAIKGDAEMVTTLVDMGASNTQYDARGFTPLHYAAEMGHRDIVQHLTTDESAEAQDMAGRTALYVACERGDASVVKELVKLSGLSGDREAVGGRRAIHVAAESGNLDLVNFLLECTANEIEERASSQSKETAEEFINCKDAEGNTPLMLAAKRGDREVFELLVQRGADAKAKNASDWTPLTIAAANGWTTVDMRRASNTNNDARGFTPLHYAAEMGHRDIFQQLTTEESAKAQDMAGRTALYVACERGDVAVVQELVKLGGLSGDREAVGGRRAIHVAAESGNTELVNFLLECTGKEVEERSRMTENNEQLRGQVAKETTEEFINSKDAEGNTPLMLAAKRGHRDVFELLVQRGADAKAKNASGWTPLTMAAANGWTSTVDIISNKTSKCVKLHKGSMHGSDETKGSE